MPVYRKDKDRWRVRVFVRGQRHDWIIQGSKKDAEKFEAEKRVELEAAPVGPTKAVPKFSTFCVDSYRPHAQANLKPSTWKNKMIYIVATLVQHFGKYKLNEITVAEVEAFIAKRLACHLKPATINGELRGLRRILNYAVELSVPAQPPRFRMLRERSRQAIKFWTDEEIGRLLSVCVEIDPAMLPLLTCLANTGLRKGEALAARWEDVDLDRRVIRIQAHPEDGWSPKTEHWREVPINDALMRFLTGPRLSSKWVFPCPAKAERWTYWPEHRFDRIRALAGLTGGPHTLRHSYASYLVRETKDLLLVARVLGHSNQRVTELYSHLLPGALDRARDAISFTPDIGPAALEAKRRWKRARPTAFRKVVGGDS